MPYCPPWNVSEGMTYQKFLLRETNARFILVVRPFSSFTQTSSESKKMYMAKDSILTVLCLCTSLFRVLYKGCKHTRDSTWMWVALNSCQSTIVLHYGFFPDEHHSHQPWLWSWWFGMTSSQLKMWTRKVSCPRALVALDHPVAVESPCWTIFQQDFSALLHSFYPCTWVESWVASAPLSTCRTILSSLPCKPVLATWYGPSSLLMVVIQAGLLKGLETVASSS